MTIFLVLILAIVFVYVDIRERMSKNSERMNRNMSTKFGNLSNSNIKIVEHLNQLSNSDKKIVEHFRHVYFLMDLMSDTLPYPLRSFYRDVRIIAPEDTPRGRKESLLLFRSALIKCLSEVRSEIFEEIEKRNRQEILSELDSIRSLLSTMDENTSEDYIVTVLRDAIVSFNKIINNNIYG